jgi:RNA-binding protein YhbY
MSNKLTLISFKKKDIPSIMKLLGIKKLGNCPTCNKKITRDNLGHLMKSARNKDLVICSNPLCFLTQQVIKENESKVKHNYIIKCRKCDYISSGNNLTEALLNRRKHELIKHELIKKLLP